MPPKKPTARVPVVNTKKTSQSSQSQNKNVANIIKKSTPGNTRSGGAANKKAAGVAVKGKSGPTVVKKASVPAAKRWTPQDDAARKIQCAVRQFLARIKKLKIQKEKKEYEELMDKLEKEAYAALVREEQARYEEQLRREDEERRIQKEHSRRRKRLLESAFDGDLAEIHTILKEVSDMDDKKGLGTDTVGLSLRKNHRYNMIECCDANGNTPLSESASGGQVDVIEFLINEGADPNSVGQFGRTPLYRAAFAGHVEAVQTLLQSGADPRIFAEDGQTPLQISTMSSVTEILENWSIEQTESLLEKIEQDKEQRIEEELQRRRAESNKLEDEVKEAEKYHKTAQKRLYKATEELNKRIHEHDMAESSGYNRPEVTLGTINDAEVELELAKVDVDKARNLLQESRLKLREQKAKYAMDDKEESDLPGNKVNIRELDDVLMRDVGNRIKDSGKWPLLIDPSEQASTFLRYRDTNYINALRPTDMEPDKIRLAILGGIRFGKPVVLDMMQVDMYEICSAKFNEVQHGLLMSIMNKSILENQKYLTLIRRGDHEEYQKNRFIEAKVQSFKFIIITRNPYPPQELIDMTYAIRIHLST